MSENVAGEETSALVPMRRPGTMSPLSFFSLRLDMIRNSKKIGSGTGFVYEVEGVTDRQFLITNYHVLTGREPQNPAQLLPNVNVPDSPDELEFSVLTEPDPSDPDQIFYPQRGGISLTNNGPWLEHRDRAEGVDIVAVPIKFPQKSIVLTQKQLDLVEDIAFEVGSDLTIVGFPFGFGAGDFLPIWKRGTVASEPLFKPNGQARFYIDATTKSGMSGAPVFATRVRDMIALDEGTAAVMKRREAGEISDLEVLRQIDPSRMRKTVAVRQFRLVGIYSGRMTVHQDQDPHIGIVWEKQLIDELFSDPHPTEHPFPPLPAEE